MTGVQTCALPILWSYLMHHDPWFSYLFYPINHLTIFHDKEKCYWKHYGTNQLIYLVWKIIFSSWSTVKFMHTFIKVIVNILLSSSFVFVIFMMHDIKLPIFANWFNSFIAYEFKKRKKRRLQLIIQGTQFSKHINHS